MRKIILILIGIFILVTPVFCSGALNPFTQSIDARRTVRGPYAWQGHPSRDLCWTWAKEIEGRLDGGTSNALFYFTPGSAPTTAAKGMIYYDSGGNSLKYYTTGWQTLGTTAGVALDDAYDLGSTITADGGAVAITVTNASGNAGITVAQNDADNNSHGIVVTMAASNTGSGLHVDGTSGTVDLLGDNFTVLNTGAATFLSVALENGEVISNATNDKILFDTGDEDLLLDMVTTADTITLSANGQGGTTFAMGDYVNITGLNTLTGVAGVDFTISAANTTSFNLVVAQTGTGDNELRLASAGTAANAIAIAAATGGVTITTGATAASDFLVTTGDDVIITSGDDITLTSTVGSLYNIATDDTTADTITIGSVKDTIVMDGVLVTIGDSTAAAATIIQCGTGDITLDSGDDIFLAANTGVGDVISLICTKGTSTSSIVVTSTVGGIDLDSALSTWITSSEEQGDAIYIHASGTAGGVDITSGTGDVVVTSTDQIALTVATSATDNIVLTNTASTDVDAISLISTAGGIQHASNDVASTWTHTADGAGDDLSFIVAGAFDGSLVLTSSGTLGNAIDINTSAGGIDIDMAGGAGGEDFDILTATSINFKTTETAADQFKMDADGAHAGNVINLKTTDGGILLNADGAANGDIGLNAANDIILTAAGDLTLAVTDTFNMAGAVIANNRITTVVDIDSRTLTAAESGSTIVFTMTGGAATATLPEATANNIGMWFILIDANVTGGRDLTIDPEGGGSINGAAGGNFIKNETDNLGEGVYIFSTGADVWYTALLGHTTVWTVE